jgi:hypothetical protein
LEKASSRIAAIRAARYFAVTLIVRYVTSTLGQSRTDCFDSRYAAGVKTDEHRHSRPGGSAVQISTF